MRHGNFYGRHFRSAVKRLVESGRWPGHWPEDAEDEPMELAKLRFHDLRHTAAAIMIPKRRASKSRSGAAGAFQYRHHDGPIWTPVRRPRR
jgi:hypothetical protein